MCARTLCCAHAKKIVTTFSPSTHSFTVRARVFLNGPLRVLTIQIVTLKRRREEEKILRRLLRMDAVMSSQAQLLAFGKRHIFNICTYRRKRYILVAAVVVDSFLISMLLQMSTYI